MMSCCKCLFSRLELVCSHPGKKQCPENAFSFKLQESVRVLKILQDAFRVSYARKTFNVFSTSTESLSTVA